MVTYVLCDDNKEYLSYLKDKLSTFIKAEDIIISYSSSCDLLNNISLYEHNTIFILDIVLDNDDGIQLANLINKAIPLAVIIYLSGYLNKVVDIFDTRYCYFIYKRELEQRLPSALHKALQALQTSKHNLLIDLTDKKVIKPLDSIHYMERIRRYTYIHCTNDDIFRVQTQLNTLKQELTPYFIQCHRSFLINLNHVVEYKRTEFILHDKSRIPISRSYSKDVHEAFQKFLTNTL